MAWIVGVLLLGVTAGTIWKYAGNDDRMISIVGPMHGFLFIVYIVTALDLSFRLRWSVVRTLLVCLAGTVPFFSFVAEHIVTRDTKALLASQDAAPSA
jgi:integral membrane protein